MLEKGLTYKCTTTVDRTNTASALGSGDMDVFATPAMIALMENAAMKAVASGLPEGSTTVGALIHATHVKPSAPGKTVTATAVLTCVVGRKLTFSVSVADNDGLIGEGEHVRYIVDRTEFLSRLS